MTRLQDFQLAFRDLVLDARDELDDDAYRALVATIQAYLTREQLRSCSRLNLPASGRFR